MSDPKEREDKRTDKSEEEPDFGVGPYGIGSQKPGGVSVAYDGEPGVNVGGGVSIGFDGDLHVGGVDLNNNS